MGWISMQREYINELGSHVFFPPLHYLLFAITLSAVRHYTNLLFAITLSAVRHYTSAVRHYTIFCPSLHFCSPPLHYLLSAITLSAVRHYTSTVLRFTVSDYPFSILKLLFSIFQYLIGNHLDCLHAYSRRFCWKRVEYHELYTSMYWEIQTYAHQWSRNCLPLRRTRVHPNSQWGSCCSIFSFKCSVLQIVVYPFVLFLSAIVLYVLLRGLIIPLVSSNFSLKDNM